MSALTNLINAYIKANNNQEITGPVLNGVLRALADAAENVPYIGSNGNWYIYDVDTGIYQDTGDPSRGPVGVDSATASVDALVGTPSVDVTFLNGVLAFAFHHIKGETGATGPAGGVNSINGQQGNVTGFEETSNKVAALSSSSTNQEYPGAKVVFDSLELKVDKVAGKGLSENDYTNADKSKLAGIAAGAQVNVIETVKVDGTALTPDSLKAVSITIKTVNDLTNYYLKTETFTRAEVQALIGAIQQFHYEIYASLSAVTTPATNVLYLIGPTGSGADKYEEYVYASGNFVKIGDTSIDLSGYVTTSDLNTALAAYTTTANLTTLLAGKQDFLVSGQNIKTVGGQSILGTGNIPISGFSGNPVVGISTPYPTDGTVIITFYNGDTVTLDLNHNHTQYATKEAESTQPVGGFLPDVVYKLGTLTGTVTFALAAAVSGNINHYFWTFDTGAVAPTISSWPAGITWIDGSEPTVSANKHYEISILDGVGKAMEA